MSDLVLRGGDIRAQGELQRGAIWGGMVNQLGQIAGKTLGDLAAYREEAPKREAQQLALTKLRREESTEKNLAGIRQMAADGNLSSLDTAKLYEQAGYQEQAQLVRQGFLANVKTMGEINAMKLDMAGHAANRVQLAGNTPDAFRAEIQGLMKSGVFTAEEVQPYLDALEQAQSQLPAKAVPGGPKVETGIETLTTKIMAKAPAYQPDLTPFTLAPGAVRMKGTQVIGTNPKPVEPPKDVSLQQEYANLIKAGRVDEAKALLASVSAYRDASTRPPAAAGAPDSLTISGRNTAIRARENDLAAAEAAYQRAISPRAATVTEFQLTGKMEHVPTVAEKADAKRRYEASVRQIQNAYEEQIAPRGETKAVMPALSPDEAAVVGRSSLGDLSRPSPIPPPGALAQPGTAEPGPAVLPPPVAAPAGAPKVISRAAFLQRLTELQRVNPTLTEAEALADATRRGYIIR